MMKCFVVFLISVLYIIFGKVYAADAGDIERVQEILAKQEIKLNEVYEKNMCEMLKKGKFIYLSKKDVLAEYVRNDIFYKNIGCGFHTMSLYGYNIAPKVIYMETKSPYTHLVKK